MSIERNGDELGRHDIRNKFEGPRRVKINAKLMQNCVEKPSQANRLSLQI